MKKQTRPHSITFTEPSLTQQHQKDEVDINNIMKRYIKTGVIDHVAKYEPQYGEFTGQDYHQSMNIVADANSMFEELPSAVRKKFNNDPASFLDFVKNPENHSKLAEMGLTNSPPEANLTPDEETTPESTLSEDEQEEPPSEPASAS